MSQTARAPARIDIARIFAPERVAVYGASDDRGKWGGRIMHYLGLHGFSGEVVPINPRRDIVAGRRCYPRIGDAPPVDVAVLAVPAPAVPATVRDCADAGVGCCVVITAGFAEAGAEGVALQDEIAAIARASGMRLVGPNCLGFINLRNGMALTSARVLDVERIVPGRIGLVSQSGALMLSVYNRAHDQGIGFSQLVSVGNQADLDLCDFFLHMIDDPDTGAICLHVEGLREGARFRAGLDRARRAGKPVVVLKTGRSEAGEDAARSHTASLAGGYAAFAAACHEAGAILVDDPDVMTLVADFALRHGPLRRGGIGIVSPSGGMNGILVDRLADAALELARFGASTREALAAVMLPDHRDNPLDIGARRPDVGEGAAVATPAVAAVCADPDVGVVVLPLTTAPNYEQSVSALAEPLRAGGKPALFIVTPGSVATPVRALIREAGIAYCDRLDDGVRLLEAWASWRPDATVTEPAPTPTPTPVLPRSGYLSEPETKALLGSFGVHVTQEEVVRSAAQATQAAERIGYPVVVKGVSHAVVHKSDAGLVRLALGDRAAVERAFDEVMVSLRRLDSAARDCVVAEMAQGDLELIVGVKHDPIFGPVVMVGAGGVLVELLKDVAVGLVPITPAKAEAMLRRLRVWPLLEGFRRSDPLDVDAVVEVLVDVGRLAVALGERLRELDINPLLVRRRGAGVIALDARAVVV